MLSINDLSAYAAGHNLLHSVSLELAEQRTLALLGPSGGGKTTLLRMIMGFSTPSSGTVSWRGTVLSAPGRILVRPEKRRFGMVFQDGALFPHLSVADNIAFGLHSLDKKTRRQLTDEWLTRLHLQRLAKRPVQGLSGGEQQRVALARTMAPKPELLLLDEPFCNLDRLVRCDLLAELKNILRETKTTTIVVTHDARDVIDLEATFVLLAAGAVVCHGSIDDLLTKGGDDWAGKFLAHGLGIADTVQPA